MYNWKNKLSLLLATLIIICSFTACNVATIIDTAQDIESGLSELNQVLDEVQDGLDELEDELSELEQAETSDEDSVAVSSFEDIPAYSESAWIEYNNNEPMFTDDEIVDVSYEYYSDLDSLGRVGIAIACIGSDIMPTEDRESISSVTPTGWVNNSYPDIVDADWLYNRCHLIGFQLTGENANELNLITGTRYMNIEGMLDFENLIADYIYETDNHVMYRVTPVFTDDNLLADGLIMEGYSVEDNGEGVSFCVYAYNVQPYITIDYTTGDNYLTE